MKQYRTTVGEFCNIAVDEHLYEFDADWPETPSRAAEDLRDGREWGDWKLVSSAVVESERKILWFWERKLIEI